MPECDHDTDFYKIVNDDGEVLQHAQTLESSHAITGLEHEHCTVALLDVLRAADVEPEIAAKCASSLVRNKHRL